MLPDMSDALFDFGDPISLGLIAKTAVDFESQETFTVLKSIYGVKTPTPARELLLLPEGERQFKYWTFYSDDTSVPLDSYLQDEEGLQYRVTDYEDWGASGFRKYQLQQVPTAGSAGKTLGVTGSETGAESA